MYSLHIWYNDNSNSYCMLNVDKKRYDEELRFQLENNYDCIKTIYVHLPNENWKYLKKENMKVSD